MKWLLNFLVKVLGAFLTSFGSIGLVQMLKQTTGPSTGWVVGFLTIGLAILFAPEIELK